MRTNNILTGLMVIIITISCTIESATPSIEDEDMTKVKELAYEFIKSDYLYFNDNQFELKITREEAIDMGFSIEAYDYILESAMQVNKAIRQELELVNNFSIYDSKVNSFDNIEQINRLIRNGHIKSKDNRTYYMDVTLAEALTLGYSREALETAIQSIEDGTIYKCGFITQPSYVNLGTNALDTKSTNYQIITGGYLETEEANLSVTEYLMLPPDQSIMNAVGVRFENKGSNGIHTFTTETEVGTMSRSGLPGGYIYVPVIMGGTYIGLTYVTTGSNGGRVDYHRAFRNDLQWY